MYPTPIPPATTGGKRRGRHRRRHDSPRRAARIAARTAIGLVSALVILSTGLAYWETHGLLGGITISRALGVDEARSPDGAMNILLIGLDSRKDQAGNELPPKILDRLHAGDSESGGYNTNTLILVHVGEDDRVVAFSIPRDDYVAVSGITGYDHIKIKEAYGLTKAQTEQELIDDGVTDQAELESAGREAGRAATIRAVRNLTGQPIDYFAEVNLAGFYHLTESLGGVEVCLNTAVDDDYSGADFPAGRQTLNAEQALAFVRQRHGLENGDLDRTHRQQAFLLAVMRQLQDSGSFTDLDRFRSLMDVAREDIVLSQGWGEDQFRRMAALAGGYVEFRTLPVLRYENINGQDVNIVDPAQIRSEIAQIIGGTATPTIDATTPPNPDTVVDVVNAGDTAGLAAKTAEFLSDLGYTTDEIRDRESGEPLETTVDYGPGAQTDAEALATRLGIDDAPQPSSALAVDHVRIVLGPGYQVPTAGPDPQPSLEPTGAEYGTTVTQTPDEGAPITADDGIPCVN